MPCIFVCFRSCFQNPPLSPLPLLFLSSSSASFLWLCVFKIGVDLSFLDTVTVMHFLYLPFDMYFLKITLNQIFRNSEDVPIEILFAFPVTKTSAISDFRVAFSDGTILRGDVEEKKRAADRYDDALAEGKNAFLVEKKDELTYTVNLGRLQPGEEVYGSFRRTNSIF